jgi:hypothetical protein
MYGAYRLFSRPYYRPIGAPPTQDNDGTNSNVNETIDVSVLARWKSDATYRPPNLIDWAHRYGVRIPDLTGSLLAADPRVAAPD